VRFTDRTDAGQRLAKRLEHLRSENPVVLGLPRGGVPVAYEVATALRAPLDVLVVRKLGVPSQPELAMGAIGEGGVRVSNNDVIRRAGVTEEEIAAVEERERADLDRQAQLFRAGRPAVDLAGRTAIIVDDGIATGATASAACEVARHLGAAKVVLAVPVGARESIDELWNIFDEVICTVTPHFFLAVGTWYDDFRHVPDDEVSALLQRAQSTQSSHISAITQVSAATAAAEPVAEQVELPLTGVTLPGLLVVPPDAPGVVIFVHGSGSGRNSPRNRRVASALTAAGLGTLLFDLLTPDEELDRSNVFDIVTLAGRLTEVTAWLRDQPGAQNSAVGYFGASTGAAAALRAAAAPHSNINSIVSRGGRPDLADDVLPDVTAPTLLIVGERDRAVLGLNRQAKQRLRTENELVIVPGATHLFEEPGALDAVTRLARDWLTAHFAGPDSALSAPDA